MVRFKFRKSLLTGMTDVLKSGILEEPRWFQVVSKVPPDDPVFKGHKPKVIRYPEDDLIRAYYRRNPESRLHPISMREGAPQHPARAFALRQLELMSGGASYKAALAQAEQEAAEAKAISSGGEVEGQVSALRAVQAKEELALHSAMRKAHRILKDNNA